MNCSLEKYIKSIYEFSLENEKIRVTDLASKLNLTKAAVSKTLNKLKNLNLIEYEKYKEIKILSEGILVAQKLIQKEKMIELFFVSVLNVEKEVAKKDYELISTYISEETNDKLYEYIKEIMKFEKVCIYKKNCDCDECHINKVTRNIKNNPNWKELLKNKKLEQSFNLKNITYE